MSVLKNDINIEYLGPGASHNAIKDAIAQEFWIWYKLHKDDRIFALKKLLFFSLTVRVHHLEPVFVLLFGSPAT